MWTISLPILLVTLVCLISVIAVALRYGATLLGDKLPAYYEESAAVIRRNSTTAIGAANGVTSLQPPTGPPYAVQWRPPSSGDEHPAHHDESAVVLRRNITTAIGAAHDLRAPVTSLQPPTGPPGLVGVTSLQPPTGPPLAVQGRPPSSGKNTTLRWVADPDFWEPRLNPLGRRSRFAVIQNVVIQDRTVHLSGLSRREMADLQNLPGYQSYLGAVTPHNFIFSDLEGGYQEPYCRVIYTGPVMLLPPHLPSNAFHVHNDLILKVAWLLRWTGETPQNTTLLLLDSPKELQRACQLFDLLELVLKAVEYPAESIFKKRACFRKLVWSPGLCYGLSGSSEPLYHPEKVSYAWKPVTRNWVQLAYSSLGYPSPSDMKAEVRDTWTMMWFSRVDQTRHISNFGEVRSTLENLPQFHTDVVVEYARGKSYLAQLFGKLLQVDVVAGLHGAGLAHALYMRPGAALVELKTSHAWEIQLFVNIAFLRELWYYAVNIKRFQHGDAVTLPPAFVQTVFQDVRERLSHHDRNRTMKVCRGGYWKDFVMSLPSNGHVFKSANDFCDIDARKADILRANPPADAPTGSIDEVCNAVKAGDVDVLKEVQGAAVMVLKSSALDLEHVAHDLPRYFLPYALASLAEVHLLHVSDSNLDMTNFWQWMRSRLFVPAKSSALTKATGQLKRAAKQVCQCTRPTCKDISVWAAFQGYWRDAFRSSLLEFMQLGSDVSRDLLAQVAGNPADLAVHMPCGDSEEHNLSNEFGYLGVSAFRRALLARPVNIPMTIRFLLAPFPGAANGVQTAAERTVVARKAACAELASNLKQRLEPMLHPADIVVDDVSGQLAVWAYLAFAKRTLCASATCLWPTLAASDGYLADTDVFFSRTHPKLTGVIHLTGLPVLGLTTVFREHYSVAEIVEWIAWH